MTPPTAVDLLFVLFHYQQEEQKKLPLFSVLARVAESDLGPAVLPLISALHPNLVT